MTQRAIHLAWCQLKHQKMRLIIAALGVAFAAVLMLMQLGFRQALFDSAVQFHRRLQADVVVLSPETAYLGALQPLARRHLYQALALSEVQDVAEIHARLINWKNPTNSKTRFIFLIGVDPENNALDIPEMSAARNILRTPDYVIFDEEGRPEYGPIAERVAAGDVVETEADSHRIYVGGVFKLGTTFGIDGNLLGSSDTYRRIVPASDPAAISLGLVRLHPNADANVISEKLQKLLGDDVVVLTRAAFIEREKDYWNNTTPIGYVFAFGVIMGFIVGAIIVYQILFADVSEHLSEYATLKAMGYSHEFLVKVVVAQGLMLAAVGFIPALLLSRWLFYLTARATHLPMMLTFQLATGVFFLTALMCGISAVLAVRRIRLADPAEIF